MANFHLSHEFPLSGSHKMCGKKYMASLLHVVGQYVSQGRTGTSHWLFARFRSKCYISCMQKRYAGNVSFFTWKSTVSPFLPSPLPSHLLTTLPTLSLWRLLKPSVPPSPTLFHSAPFLIHFTFPSCNVCSTWICRVQSVDPEEKDLSSPSFNSFFLGFSTVAAIFPFPIVKDTKANN